MHEQLSISPDPLDAPSVPPIIHVRARTLPLAWAALLALGPILLLIFQLMPVLDQAPLHSPLAHVVIALAAAVTGVFLALLVLRGAQSAYDARVLLVGLGFLSTASIFGTHAVATPSVLLSDRGLAASISAPLSLVVGGLFLALSGLGFSPAANRAIMRRARWLVLAYVACWLCFNWVVLVIIPANTRTASAVEAAYYQHASDPTSHAGALPEQATQAGEYAPAPVSSISTAVQTGQLPLGVLAIGLAAFGFAVWRHYRLYRHSPSYVGFALVLGIALLGEALLTQYFARVYTLSFWLYHAQEFVGLGAISYAMLMSYRRGLDGASLLESVLLAGTRARLQAGYAQAMDALIGMLGQGESPSAAAREALRTRFHLSDSQLLVFEGAAQAVAQERRQRTELERLNQMLRQLEEHKRQLTQMVIHDLKNPLTALTGYLEVLNLGALSPNQHDLVAGALSSSKNLAGLIGDLLDVAQIEEGQLALEYSTFAVGDLLQQCVEGLQGWLLLEDKAIMIELPHDALLVSADLRLLRRVVLNLLSNAIKHTPPRTQIWLRAFAPAVSAPPGSLHPALGRQLIIEVEDTGPGIPADQLDHIFERFGRYQSSPASGRQTSTGLGLTFCRLVAEAHGGSIGVSSAVGRGTTFRVLLPGR